MKILFLSAWFPFPPNNGTRIRVYNLIKALSKRHDVYLVSLLQEDSNPEDVANLADICQIVSLHEGRWFQPNTVKALLGFFSSRPRSNVDTFDPAIKAAVQSAIAQVKPDVLVVSTLHVVEYVLDNLDIPSVLIDHNCEFAVLRRSTEFIENPLKKWRFELGWRKFARWEAQICKQFTKVVMVSEEDRQNLLDFAPYLDNVHVVANAADTEHYNPDHWRPQPNTFVYHGALTYTANRDAAEFYASSIYPLLREQLPEAKLHITGRTDGVDLGPIAACPGIELTGYVDDIRTILYSSTACIIPLRQGGGMRLKIPEAMAAGLPVITTSMGAEGLSYVDGEHLLIANTPAEFVDAMVRVTTDPMLVQRLRRNARALVEEKYSWAASGGRFTDLVEAAHSEVGTYALAFGR